MTGQTWIGLALVSAFSLATSDALAKRSLQGRNEYIVAWLRLVFAMPFLIATWFFIPMPHPDTVFFRAFMTALPLEIIAVVLYFKALKASPLSLTLPFLSLTPVMLVPVSYFVLGERVSFEGGIGIILIAAGSYVLNMDEARNGLLGPLRAVGREKGSLYMIGVAFIYSITSSLGKMAISHSSPLFFGITYYSALNIAFVPIVLMQGKGELRRFMDDGRAVVRYLMLAGLFQAVMVVTHMIAVSMTRVAYMISVKRTSILIGVIYGFLFFSEKKIRWRMTGALMMFGGFVLLVIQG